MFGLIYNRSLYMGNDLKQFNKIRDYLDCAHIKYRYKIIDTKNRWDGRSNRSALIGYGSNDFRIIYEIVIREKDYNKINLSSIT